MNGTQLCLVLCALTITCMSADHGPCKPQQVIIENHNHSVVSEKALEKEKFRQQVLERSFRANQNFERVDPQLNRAINQREQIILYRLKCIGFVMACALVIVFRLKNL